MADQPALLEQLRSFSQRLTRMQKMIIGGSVVVALIGVFAIIGIANKTQMGVLFSELEAKDAAVITDKLREKNIQYELQNGGSTVLVPTDVLHETRISLASEGLPESSVVGYELFDKTNLGMSDFVQKLNYRRALEGELSRTISSISEIKKARVHIVIPEKALFEKDQKKPSASTVLQFRSGKNINKLDVTGIQNLVASSVEGLEPGAVTIVDQKGQILSEPQREKGSLSEISSTQYELQQKVDQYLTSKAQSLLDGVLGAGNAVVRTTAELDFQQIETTKENYGDEPVIRSEQSMAGKSSAVDSLNYPATNSNSENQNQIRNYEISKTVERIVNNGGGIKRLTVSALVNGTTKIVEENGEPALKYTPRPTEQMQQLGVIVKNAVGFDPSRNDQISVENIQFDISQEEEELARRKELDIPVTVQELIERIVIIFAMTIAVWMIRKLITSEQVRSRIEWVLGPPPEIDPNILATLRGDSDQLLLSGAGFSQQSQRLLPSGGEIDKGALAAKAKARLDGQLSQDLTEDDFVKEEIGARVKEYMSEKSTDAARLLNLMLQQDIQTKKTR